MASYALLDQAEEDSLHKTRLLTVEERPFKRITKRLLDPERSIINKPPTLPPTPPPDPEGGDEENKEREEQQQQILDKRRQWREEVLLDFAAFESSIIRTQFLITSNSEEREGYAQKKLKIEATAQAVRDNTASLRIQLSQAQHTLATRKEYDLLAEKITNNRLLRPRDEQHANLEKLNSEIAELIRESEEYAETWNRRRQQFDKIIDQTTEMQRQIKDEKEEVERREGMEEGDDDEHRESASGTATPKPEVDDATSTRGGTNDLATDASHALAVEKSLKARGRSSLHESQSANDPQGKQSPIEDIDEGEMAEDGEVSPEAEAASGEAIDAADEDDKEESEQEEAHAPRDRMDVT